MAPNNGTGLACYPSAERIGFARLTTMAFEGADLRPLRDELISKVAAGTAGAYLARAGRAVLNQPFTLHQGRFTGRPSQIEVEPRGSAAGITRILVGGWVAGG